MEWCEKTRGQGDLIRRLKVGKSIVINTSMYTVWWSDIGLYYILGISMLKAAYQLWKYIHLQRTAAQKQSVFLFYISNLTFFNINQQQLLRSKKTMLHSGSEKLKLKAFFPAMLTHATPTESGEEALRELLNPNRHSHLDGTPNCEVLV